jgi:hypothetical protein
MPLKSNVRRRKASYATELAVSLLPMNQCQNLRSLSILGVGALSGLLALTTLSSCGGGDDGSTSTKWTVSTFSGSGQYGSADGNASAASFANPLSVATDRSGTVFVADSFNHKIRKIATDGTVTTLGKV